MAWKTRTSQYVNKFIAVSNEKNKPGLYVLISALSCICSSILLTVFLRGFLLLDSFTVGRISYGTP